MNTFIERAHRSISRSDSENITRVLKHIRSTSNAIFQLYQLTLQTFTLVSLSLFLFLSNFPAFFSPLLPQISHRQRVDKLDLRKKKKKRVACYNKSDLRTSKSAARLGSSCEIDANWLIRLYLRRVNKRSVFSLPLYPSHV